MFWDYAMGFSAHGNCFILIPASNMVLLT